MPLGIGPLELIIVLVIVLVIFGPKRLPGLGRSLGSGMREFKDSITGKDDSESTPDRSAESERIKNAADPSVAKGDGDAVEEHVSGERRG